MHAVYILSPNAAFVQVVGGAGHADGYIVSVLRGRRQTRGHKSFVGLLLECEESVRAKGLAWGGGCGCMHRCTLACVRVGPLTVCACDFRQPSLHS